MVSRVAFKLRDQLLHTVERDKIAAMVYLQATTERILEGLTQAQKEAVTHAEGPLLVAAGPGSGKTRVIAHRVAYLAASTAPSWAILAVTFTNKAADEMRQRIASLCGETASRVSTFHSFCAYVLRQDAPLIGYPATYTIYDAADSKAAVQGALKQLAIDSTTFSPSAVAEEISKAKTVLLSPDDYASQASGYRQETVARIYRAYQNILKEAAAMDFDDLLNQALLLFREHPEALSRCRNRFRYILIDEFQDTNRAQFELANLLAGVNGNIFAVGDIDQSIYTWRGAHPRNVFAFLEHHDQAKVIMLDTNFRSTRTIVRAADELIKNNKIRLERRLTTTNQEGPPIRLLQCSNEVDEAEGVAEMVRGLVENGRDPSQIAVLYRTNAQSRALEEAFIDARIPYQLVESVSFYQRAEVKDLLAYLRLAANPADQLAFRRIINVPRRSIGRTTLDAITAIAREQGISLLEGAAAAAEDEKFPSRRRKALSDFVQLIHAIRSRSDGPVEPLLRSVIAKTSYLGHINKVAAKSADEKRANVEELVSAAAHFDSEAAQPSLVEFLERVSLVSDADKFASDAGAVSMMTLHTAKGLEFESVFIAGVEDGLLPHHASAESPEEIEEERRLFYVGITRAKSLLTLTYTRARTIYGSLSPQYPSEFIYELPRDALVEGTRTTAPRQSPEDALSKGDIIYHSEFGMGKVVSAENGGEKLVIEFGVGNRKTIMVRYANIRKLSKEQEVGK